MAYVIAPLTAGMLAYMVWMLVFRLRHDRVRTERQLTRGKFAFGPRERARLLLKNAFGVSNDRPEWEGPLVSSIAAAPVEQEKEEAR